MKKSVFLVAFLLIVSAANAQSVNVDSLAQIIVQEKVLEKVNKHDKVLERMEWTSPALIAPTIVVILGMAGMVWGYFWGFKKRIDSIIESEEIKNKVDRLVEERLVSKLAEEEKSIKAKAVHIVFAPGTAQQDLVAFLKDTKGFAGVKAYSTEDRLQINTNDIVLFANEQDDLYDLIPGFLDNNTELKSKARFFYYNTTHRRWENPDVKMVNFANSRDTLADRLLETLKK